MKVTDPSGRQKTRHSSHQPNSSWKTNCLPRYLHMNVADTRTFSHPIFPSSLPPRSPPTTSNSMQRRLYATEKCIFRKHRTSSLPSLPSPFLILPQRRIPSAPRAASPAASPTSAAVDNAGEPASNSRRLSAAGRRRLPVVPLGLRPVERHAWDGAGRREARAAAVVGPDGRAGRHERVGLGAHGGRSDDRARVAE